MGSIISSYNKHILNSNSTEDGCNSNNRDECPLETNVCFLELYTELMSLITKLINTNITMVSQILHSKSGMKIIKRLSDIDHI